MDDLANQNINYDIVIVGGGLVGLSAALALSTTKLSIAIIEPEIFHKKTVKQEIGRKLALNIASQRIFSSLNIWTLLQKQAMPMQKIEVSQQAAFGKTQIRASDYQLPALGYVIEETNLTDILQQQALASQNVTVFMEAQVLTIEESSKQLTIQQKGQQHILRAKLIVVADGTQSQLREQLHFSVEQKDYHSKALVTYVELAHVHKNIAYQHFLKQGSLALLPLLEKTYAVIWTATDSQIEELLQLSDEYFLKALQQQFGYRLGKLIGVHKRGCYPLKLQYSEQQVKEGIVLLGNSAHTIAPVAAQGFNLSLRCIAKLTETIEQAIAEDKVWYSLKNLQSYQTDVRLDQKNMIELTDSLVSWFAVDSKLLRCLRSVGLLGLDLLPPVKARFAKRMMGLYGRAPKLVRGVTSS